MKEIVGHPLMEKFRRKSGSQMSKTDSKTMPDFQYVIELDETRRIPLRGDSLCACTVLKSLAWESA